MQAIALHQQHIPMATTSLVGRERDLARITELLSRPETRLVTLTGPGGVGKTRLALQLAHDHARELSDEVVLVMLASVDDAAGVLPAIARSMSLSQSEAMPVEESVIAAVGSRRVLLILDNAEQVAEHLSMLATLLARCPALTILVTSQIMLRLSAEQVVPIEPLPAVSVSARDLAPATALFVERARAVRADLDVTPETVRAIDHICQQLDGLPLAIELAAARTRFLSPTALRDRISERLPVLVGGPRDAPERHQTLRATLRWSHDLLDDAERTLFRRLAVFRGSAPYDAIEPVCNADGALGGRTEEVLEALVDHSLVRISDRPATGPRVRLLNTIREFAQEQLLESGEADALAAAHAIWFTHLVIDQPEDHWRTGTFELREWIIRHEPDVENLRVALERMALGEDKAPVLELITGLGSVWMELGMARDGRPWTQRLLPHVSAASPRVQVRFLFIAAVMAALNQSHAEALALAERSLALAERIGYPRMAANAQNLIGTINWQLGNAAEGERMQMLAVETIRTTPDRMGGGMFIASIGEYLTEQGDAERGEALLREGIEAIEQERPDAAPLFHGPLGLLLLQRGDLDGAGAALGSSLGYHRDPPHRQPVTLAHRLCDIGRLALLRGLPDRAARLLGAAQAILDRLGIARDSELQERTGPLRRALEAELDEITLHREVSVGKGMPVPAAIALAEEIARIRPEARSAAGPETVDSPVEGLTARQREILRLLTGGRSNAAIAAELFISERTVTTHLTRIYDRLGVGTRGEAVARAHQLGIVPPGPDT